MDVVRDPTTGYWWLDHEREWRHTMFGVVARLRARRARRREVEVKLAGLPQINYPMRFTKDDPR